MDPAGVDGSIGEFIGRGDGGAMRAHRPASSGAMPVAKIIAASATRVLSCGDAVRASSREWRRCARDAGPPDRRRGVVDSGAGARPAHGVARLGVVGPAIERVRDLLHGGSHGAGRRAAGGAVRPGVVRGPHQGVRAHRL